jgi:hypothetical protein
MSLDIRRLLMLAVSKKSCKNNKFLFKILSDGFGVVQDSHSKNKTSIIFHFKTEKKIFTSLKMSFKSLLISKNPQNLSKRPTLM